MSDYISKSALMDALIYCDGFGRKSLEAVVKTINEQQTLDEKEIIRKATERTVERVEEVRQKYQRLQKEQGEKEDEAINILFREMMKIVKEEGGIE